MVEVPLVVSGPALGGKRVFWGEWTPERMFVLVRSPGAGPRVVHRKGSTPSRDFWFPGGFAASPSLLAFHRGWTDCSVPRKEPRGSRAHGRFKVNKGLLPHEEETEEVGVCGGGGGDALVGRPLGPFQPVSGKRYCPDESGISVDVDGGVLAFGETFCRRGTTRRRIVVREFASGREARLQNAVATSECCGGVRIAGRFVAWREPSAVVVYDLAVGRPAYRARVSKKAWASFDVQRDGKVVVAIARRINYDRPSPASLVWFSSDQRAGRLVSNRALFTGVRLAGDRVLFERVLGRGASELVLSDFAGRARRIELFRKGNRRWADFDFDGDTIAWASRQDRAIRRVCGPRSCRTVADGVIQIWVTRIDGRGSKPRLIVERPYSGLHPVR
jgi:hypothetical protein